MTEVKFTNETGWVKIPGNTEKIVAHFIDGHSEIMTPFDLACLRSSIKKQIFLLDCYAKGETIKIDKEEEA